MAGVIFVKAGIAALTLFTGTETPNQPRHQGDSVVRVAVGLNSHDHNAPPPNNQPWDADGTTPAMLAFNELGGYIGWSDWQSRPRIKSGTYRDVTIYQGKGSGQQAPYLQLFAGTNAVCIAYISQQWSGGQLRGWVGDMGTACGMPTYYSHLFVGNDGHAPDCMWLDADHSGPNGNKIPAAVQIHMQEYTNMTTDFASVDPSHFCSQECMIFERENPPYDFKNPAPDYPSLFPGGAPGKPCCMKNKKRQLLGKRAPGLANRLITSPREQHSATKLCDRENSYGPDFVSWDERVFCDMESKISWPLCEGRNGTGLALGRKDGNGTVMGELKEECYEWETHSLVGKGGERLAKNYKKIDHWE